MNVDDLDDNLIIVNYDVSKGFVLTPGGVDEIIVVKKIYGVQAVFPNDGEQKISDSNIS